MRTSHQCGTVGTGRDFGFLIGREYQLTGIPSFFRSRRCLFEVGCSHSAVFAPNDVHCAARPALAQRSQCRTLLAQCVCRAHIAISLRWYNTTQQCTMCLSCDYNYDLPWCPDNPNIFVFILILERDVARAIPVDGE